MGNRGLETRNSKRSHHYQQQQNRKENPLATLPNTQIAQPVTVGALEVQNVKRAINRYGTLPKGARIGAFLESLRQTNDGTIIATPIVESATAQQVTPPNGSNLSPRSGIKTQPQMIRSNSSSGVTMANSATASLNKLQRHRTTTDGTMISFSSFRGASGSPKRSMQPSLADLEFPPPPLDLPPPSEECEMSTADSEISQSKLAPPSNDVSNTEPSVEEASTRFGVSLRKREPSTDSCSSLGSPGGDGIDLNLTIGTKDKLEMKLVAEIKERAELKQSKNDVPKISIETKINNNCVDPISQLVSELAEQMNLPKPAVEPLYKTPDCIGIGGYRKPGAAAQLPPKPIENNTNTFKSQLKKVDRSVVVSQKDEINTIIDFKSRLRKVESNSDGSSGGENFDITTIESKDVRKNNGDTNKLNENEMIKIKKSCPDSNNKVITELKKTEIKIDILDDKNKCLEIVNSLKVETEEDKRKSTGSISSLKKLWEAKESSVVPNEQQQISQLSPKMSIKNLTNKTNFDEENDEQQIPIKKPAVPVKPIKFTIYATPTTNPTTTTAATINTNVNRETILELVNLVEGSLKTPVCSISASQWLQLSDKLNILQNSCVAFADKESLPLHSKFHFRELVTRVECQSRSLRSAGSKNVQDNEKLVLEVGQSLKQISNALHR